MEYSVHGSHHGNLSSHGGSVQSPGSGSFHGFLTPRSDNDVSVSSSTQSFAKNNFKQLEGLEDGWLIELLYKAAARNQRLIFDVACKELEKVYKEIVVFEEERVRRLHPLMVAFVPRQQRVFVSLPDHMKPALENLVGLRIDGESLQAHIDELIRDRSSDRLKKSQKSRSSIMNRSRLNAVKDTPDAEVEYIERLIGDPFDSSLILMSKVAELKPSGLGKIVNSSWKASLLIVTQEGNFHVFELPGAEASVIGLSPAEAFRFLYPAMTFDSFDSWVQRRKYEMVRRLTPAVSLNLRRCKVGVSRMISREFEIMEEEVQTKNSFFGENIIKAVKEKQRPTKCTLRLSSAQDTSEWVGMLEKNMQGLTTVTQKNGRRFRV